MEVTPGQQLTIEVETGEGRELRPFTVPAGVRHLTVCLKHGNGPRDSMRTGGSFVRQR
jgi:hypothetical protein